VNSYTWIISRETAEKFDLVEGQVTPAGTVRISDDVPADAQFDLPEEIDEWD